MDRQKDDTYYAKRILSDLEYITLHMQNIADSEFAVNEILQDAMMFRLIQISENAELTFDFSIETPQICDMTVGMYNIKQIELNSDFKMPMISDIPIKIAVPDNSVILNIAQKERSIAT